MENWQLGDQRALYGAAPFIGVAGPLVPLAGPDEAGGGASLVCDGSLVVANSLKIFIIGLSAVLTMMRR